MIASESAGLVHEYNEMNVIYLNCVKENRVIKYSDACIEWRFCLSQYWLCFKGPCEVCRPAQAKNGAELMNKEIEERTM